MTVEWKIIDNTTAADATLEPISYVGTPPDGWVKFTYTNLSAAITAINCGVYLKEALMDVPPDTVSYPSTLGKAVDWYDVQLWNAADSGHGIFLKFGSTPPAVAPISGWTPPLGIFPLQLPELGLGGSPSRPISLGHSDISPTIGSGPDNDWIAAGAQFDVWMYINPPPSITNARRVYFSLEVLHGYQ
jgi:hypothetical protein